ncbi:MAG: hypothetical protein AAF732_10595 [Pseudomonadota bacterium]
MPGSKPNPALELPVDVDWLKSRLRTAGKRSMDVAQVWSKKSAAAVSKVFDGSRRMSLHEFVQLCRLLKAPPEEVLPRVGYKIDAAKMTVKGEVLSDGNVTTITVNVGKQRELPPIDSDLSLLLCTADSGPMAPYNDAMIVYQEADLGTVPPGAYDRLSIIEIAGMAQPVMGVLTRGRSRKSAQVRFFATGETQDVENVIRASPVVAILMP